MLQVVGILDPGQGRSGQLRLPIMIGNGLFDAIRAHERADHPFTQDRTNAIQHGPHIPPIVVAQINDPSTGSCLVCLTNHILCEQGVLFFVLKLLSQKVREEEVADTVSQQLPLGLLIGGDLCRFQLLCCLRIKEEAVVIAQRNESILDG